MYFLEHNHDTSLNAFAKSISDGFKQFVSYRNIPDFERVKDDDFVVIADDTMQSELESLVEALNTKDSKTFLPRLILAQSKELDYSFALSQLKHSQNEMLTLVNTENSDEKVHLEGCWFEFTNRAQIIMLSNSRFIARELSLELVRVINRIKRINYSLRLFDDATPNKFYQVDDYGFVDILGFENANMQSQVITDKGVIAVGVEFMMRESYFRLKDADIYRRYEIKPTVLNEDDSFRGEL